MIGSFLTRGLVMVFGYAYPAYECYKSVEQNKPEIEQLRFWCQYWILVALLTVCERIGDAFVSWVPMYSEAKLAFFIYLWYPKTRGTTYVYNSFFRPYVAKHENDIDRNLLELRTRAGDITFSYWQRASSHVQTRVFEILQYIVAQSTPAPQAAQNPQGQGGKPSQPRQSQGAERRPATGTRRQPSDAAESASFVSSTTLNRHQKEMAEEVGPSQVSKPGSSRASSSAPNANASSENASEEINSIAEPKQSEPVPSPGEAAEPPPKETIIEETVRLTRARLRALSGADS